MCKDSDGAMQGKICRALNDVNKIRYDRFIRLLDHQLHYMAITNFKVYSYGP